MDRLLQTQGYDSTTWLTRSFPGAPHNEAAWKKRTPLPLKFLLGPAQ